jgi:hypothetical protein
MENLIVSRTARVLDAGTMCWLVGRDERAFGVEDCGCGEPTVRRLISKPHADVIMMTYEHGHNLRCQMGFENTTWRPLPWQDYCKIMGIDSDYEDDDQG